MGAFNNVSVSRVAIIGAGPVGIAFAKYLLAEKVFNVLDIFEQRSGVGGVWNLSTTEKTQRIPIPQLDPWYGSDRRPSASDRESSQPSVEYGLNNDSLEFESPLYDYLETNIPKQIMRYSDAPFPDEYPLFPSHGEVLRYLEDYAADVKSMIKFQTQVQDVRAAGDAAPHRWTLTSKHLVSGRTSTDGYDAVVVANGHYTVPWVPAINGLAQWAQKYPKTIFHSKVYRKPENYSDQRVLVIGNSASGTDLAKQIEPYSSKVYLASKSPSQFGNATAPKKEAVEEVVEFLYDSDQPRAVKTKDGTIISDLDIVIFATGYLYSFPFLSSLDPPIITDGSRARGIYQHFLHKEHPTLAFPCLNIKVIPFGLAENQAAVTARIWSGRLPFPSKEDMDQWEQDNITSKGDGRHFHLKMFPEDAAQMNDLYEWAASARRRYNLENSGNGKLGMFWDEKRVWLRSKFPQLKMAYDEMGVDKRKIRTPADLGFSYESWLKQADSEDLTMFERGHVPKLN